MQSDWTTAGDLRAQVGRLWERGVVLREVAEPSGVFPKRLVLKRPTSLQMRDRFADVRSWATDIRSARHVRIVGRTARHRVLGTNSLPGEAWVDTADDAAAMIAKRRQLAAFRRLLAVVGDRQPALVSWLGKRPLRALEIGPDWEGLLGVVEWLQEHPRPGVYVRQMDVPGVDTKFVESYRGVLAQLLDMALPGDAIDPSCTGVSRFDSRYGFRTRPRHVRIRMLDPRCALLPWRGEDEGQELVLSAASFANLEADVGRVIVTENETNFLALPLMKQTMAIFGAGYGLEAIGTARWLDSCQLYYWGDIDTHGFAILNELRSYCESVESLLMDRDTFLRFKSLWGREPKPTCSVLATLTSEEHSLYRDLLNGRYGPKLRLEQERIAFGWVKSALSRLPSPARQHPGRLS